MKKLLLLLTFNFLLFTFSRAQEYATFTLTGEHQGTGAFTNAVLSNFTWQATGTLAQEVQILDDEVFDDGNEFEDTFGQADFEQNLRVQVIPNGNGTQGHPVTSTATLTLNFDQLTPANKWGFCVVDLDVENCLISAIDKNDNEVSNQAIDNWLIELFDCNLVEDGLNIPKWDASHAALLGSDTPGDYVVYNNLVIGGMPSNEASAAFFKPDIPLKSLAIYFENLQEDSNVSLHFYVASLHPTGINQNIENHWSIFPNPAFDIVCLQSAVSNLQSAIIEIIDLSGRKLIKQQFPAGTATVEIDVSHLKSGIYFCRLTVENKSVTKKLIIK